MQQIKQWKDQADKFKVETYALYLACKDPEVPWYAKAIVAGVVGYFLSPIDLIPDFIPVLGYLDDLIIVPLGIALALKMIPAPVMAQCRARAQESLDRNKSKHRVAAGFIIVIWLLLLALLVILIARAIKR